MLDSTTPIREFAAATAARQPTPGGGSVTALVGALAAAIGEMTVNYSIGKKGLEDYQDELKPVREELQKARELLLQLMVEDQAAYEKLTEVRKLPADAAQRSEQVAAALLACVRAPEAMAATSVLVLERCDRLVNFINPYLLSDLAVCADLAMASIRCAIYNVRVNLKELTDSSDRVKIEGRIGQILTRAVLLIQSVSPRIWDRAGQEG